MLSKYVVFPEPNVVEVKTEELKTDGLGPKEVLIRNEASIISPGTELATLAGKEIGVQFPKRPGYGSIGKILAKGNEVNDFEVGDRVFYSGYHASVQRFTHEQGHQWGHLFPVLKDLDPVEAALGCMVEISMTAPNFTELRIGDTVVVYGLGIVGMLAALMYKIKGAHVIAADPVQKRCDLAISLGIDEVVSCPPDQQVEEVMKRTGGLGASFTVDAVGHSAIIRTCVKTTAPLGEILLLGSPRAPLTGDINEIMWDVHLNGKSIRGMHMFRYPVKSGRGVKMDVEWAFATAFDLIKKKRIDARKLISHLILPDDAPATYTGLRENLNEYFCTVIDWRNEQ